MKSFKRIPFLKPINWTSEKDSYGPHWKSLSETCKRHANYRCVMCGWKPKNQYERGFLHSHHKIPRSEGGPDTLDNLICICKNCHRKHHKHMQSRKDQWLPVG